MNTLEEFIDDHLFTCSRCGTMRLDVEFDNIPESRKKEVKEMMDAIEISLEDALIVYCGNCDEYSVMGFGCSDEFL